MWTPTLTLAAAAAAFVVFAPERATLSTASTRPVETSAEADAQKKWEQAPAMMIDAREPIIATMTTNMGEIVLELNPMFAPRTVNNFVFLATEDFYDGVTFHRVINDFMIQGGDPTGTGRGGPGYQFYDETYASPLGHEKYVISMANAGPNTNGSQFFITDRAVPQLNGRHTVFGKVIEGQDVVEAISETRTGAGDRPVQDVVIEDIVVDGYGADTSAEEAPAADAPSTQPAESD